MNQNGRKLLFDPPRQFAAQLALSSYLRNAAPVNCDLNGAEMITASDDCGFESTKGNWANNGNHSATRDATYHHSGAASLEIVASGVGDNAANFESLPAAAFATIISGNKYTIEVWAYGSTPGVTLSMRIGDQVVTGEVVYNAAAGTFTKLVFNFLATSSTVTQPIQLYASGAGTIWVDDISLTQAFDVMIVIKAKCFANANYKNFFRLDKTGDGGIDLETEAVATNALNFHIGDGTTDRYAEMSGVYSDGLLRAYVLTADRIGNMLFYRNGVPGSPTTIATTIGKVSSLLNFSLGRYLFMAAGEFQFVRFTVLPSDMPTTVVLISARACLSSYANGAISAWYNWFNGSYRDKSGNGNDLSVGAGNVPIVRI